MTGPGPDWITEPFTVIDGGLSTALEALGHRPQGLLWTAELVVEQPDVVVQAHRSFVDAGADIVISSSYQASVEGFVRAGLDAVAARSALASTTELARRSGARWVAASIGPYGAILGDGSEYHGRYTADWHQVRAFHRSRLQVLTATQPDLFAIETIPSAVEAEIVLDELARITSTPAWLSVTCRDERATCAGDAIEVVARLASGSPSIAAFGVNCTDPRHVSVLLQRASCATDLPLVAYPNHGGSWDAERKCWHDSEADHLTHRVAEWVQIGARLVGGCCGVGSEGVARLVQARAALGCAHDDSQDAVPPARP
jgi:homocysteine S-methyltransferase